MGKRERGNSDREREKDGLKKRGQKPGREAGDVCRENLISLSSMSTRGFKRER